MKKTSKRFFVMVMALVLMFSLVPAISFAATITSADKTADESIKIESKSKIVNYKVTWNANGGKIGSKKTVSTTVQKGSKINKLATTPKRSGYTFKGWYTKKSGGTKISKNTKPAKSLTYYAQWKKNTDSASKLVGGVWTHTTYNSWPSFSINNEWYRFYDNGKFEYNRVGISKKTGNYKVSNGKITFTNVLWDDFNKIITYPNTVAEYQFVKENGKEYLEIAKLEYSDYSYLYMSSAVKWSK